MPAKKPLTYADSGVDIHAGDQMVDMIESHVRRTYGPRVMGQFGAFAGCFRLDSNRTLFKRNYRKPVLVSCTDGVGTKVKLAAQLKVYDTVGIDLVAMNVNDMIVQGADPLFFLDYLAVHKLDPAVATQMVKGIADGCVLAQCSLLGGETAEMPDVYAPGDFDMAGFAVGVCELDQLIDGSAVKAGDVLLGLESSGVHSNGYSLVRAIVRQARLKLDRVYPELDPERTLGQVLLTPTRIYVQAITSLLHKAKLRNAVHGMSHITGSGLPGNVPRALGKKLDARIDLKSWQRPSLFEFLQRHGAVADAEMFDVFNMGIGYVLMVDRTQVEPVVAHLEKAGERVHVIGRIVRGRGAVQLQA